MITFKEWLGDHVDEAEIVCFNTARTGYHPNQVGRTMTVGELISELENYDEEAPVFFRNDDGYTYGPISYHVSSYMATNSRVDEW